MLAVAVALAQFKLFTMPSGGSVSLESLPILVLAARRGCVWGATTGTLMGLIKFAMRPVALGAVQIVFDYPLAFACLGLAGAGAWHTATKAMLMSTLANLARLLCHVLAGFYFLRDSSSFQAALAGSVTYNLTHMLPETILCAMLAGYLTTQRPELVARSKDSLRKAEG